MLWGFWCLLFLLILTLMNALSVGWQKAFFAVNIKCGIFWHLQQMHTTEMSEGGERSLICLSFPQFMCKFVWWYGQCLRVTLGSNICVSNAILCALSVIATAGICFNLCIMKNRHTSKELTSLLLGKEGRWEWDKQNGN